MGEQKVKFSPRKDDENYVVLFIGPLDLFPRGCAVIYLPIRRSNVFFIRQMTELMATETRAAEEE